MVIEPSQNSCQDLAASPAAIPREITLDDGTPSLLSLGQKRNMHTVVRRVGGYLVSGYSTIEVLPVELIWNITECLELHEAAALALSSKQMLHKFGFTTFKQVPPTGFSPAPRARWTSTPQNPLPLLREVSRTRRVSYAIEEGLLLIYSRSKSVGCRGNCHRLFSLLDYIGTWSTQSCRRTGHYTVKDLKSIEEFHVHDTRVNYTSECVIANGKHLLKTVLALFPCEGGAKEQTASAPLLLSILRKQKLEACCGHVSWAESYPTIFHPQPNPRKPSDADPMPITNGPCVWNSR